MSNNTKKSQAALILGGGKGGHAFLELLDEDDLFHIVGIVDIDPNAPAIILAKKIGVPTFDSAEKALHACMPCTAFNLTHDKSVSDLLKKLDEHCGIIGPVEATLIYKMITKLKNTRDEFQKNQTFTQSIINNAMEGMILINSRGIIQSFNPAAEVMFGYTQEEVLEKNISMLMPEPDMSAHDGYLDRYIATKKARVVGIEREVTALQKNGQTFPISLSVNEMFSDNERFFIGIVSDITERKNNEAKIKQLAHFDAVTFLPNRVLFFDRLKHALAQAKRYKQKFAVFFLDLDGFKSINDNFGHDAGDALLKMVASRLLKVIREMDTVSRFGGDEFAFIINNIDEAEDAAVVAQKVLGELAKPFSIKDNQCNIGGCIGIALFPKNSTDVESLIKQADIAMYEVKNNGKNSYTFFDKTMKPK